MSLLAFVLVFGAALAHAAWNIIAHGVSRAGLPFLWWGAVASTVLWAFAVPFTGGLGTDDLWGVGIGVLVSGVLHVAYMLVLQHGYRVGNLSTVYATARGTGPFLAVLIAIVLLGERPTPLALVGVAAIIVGVVAIGFVDRGASGSPRRGIDPALLFGLLTGVAIAVYTIWDAHAVRTWNLSPVAFMVGTTLVQIPFYSFAVRRQWGAVRELGRRQWRRILAFGILSPLSYILVLTAITMAPVALVAPLREVSVVLVSLFGAFVLKESRPGWRVAASVVVLAGVILLAV
ncbi:drug/metabolite transporter (DMT)-like permease [Microbacterium keratanolyticum]|uniref:Membrane protein n=1 Tax=Microbacterium keratanolyticum TaxID=67574 RepID=A0A9W6HS73_9MICO|nr:EamA family transporter [Microbacterium keratanolyticum]MBM7469354.1 drug/metabolite transporter (DMT)-like permease [Microbacterium keratanolyticum]GLK01435.1 membrane protein [Microbacterium keratanolyticum]